jgi:hypothetical protein
MKVMTAVFQLIIASMMMIRKSPKTTVLSEFCDWERYDQTYMEEAQKPRAHKK